MFGKKKLCNHKWEDQQVIVIDNKYPRRIMKCKRCGVSVHAAIITFNKLAEKEMMEMRD